MSERKSALKLTTKIHTRFGILSFILGILSIIFFVIAVSISAFSNRGFNIVQYQIGIFEILAMLLSLVGIAYGIVGETTKDTYKIYAHLGLGISIIAGILHLFVVIFSISSF